VKSSAAINAGGFLGAQASLPACFSQSALA
jgi:hypothetical protein